MTPAGRIRLALNLLVWVLLPLELASQPACRAHNLGAGLVGQGMEVTVGAGTFGLEYTVEIPASAWIREYRSDPRRPPPDRPDAERAFSSLLMANLQRGLILLWNGQEIPLEWRRGVLEMSGLKEYDFFQYRLSLEGTFPEGDPGTLVLINRNYAGFQNVYSISLRIGPAWRLQETNLQEPGQRFLLDAKTGLRWSLWEGLRSLTVRLRPAPAWRSLLGVETEPVRIRLDDVLGKSTGVESRKERPPSVLQDDTSGGSATGRIKALLMQEDPDAWLLAAVLLLAFFLGAVHALSPGHGKVLVGAYLVGTHGRPVDAITLGLVVTASHVSSVILLGVISLAASRTFVPETLFPYIEMASSLLLMGLGGWMLKTRWPHPANHKRPAGEPFPANAGGAAHAHVHPHPHGHRHPHPHDHAHHHTHSSEETPANVRRDVRWKELLSLGVSGGMVPCPSALAILLLAIALGKIAFGICILVSFSLGLASVLVAVGLVLVWARPLLGPTGRQGSWTVWLPVLSSLLVFLLGSILLGRALLLRSVWG